MSQAATTNFYLHHGGTNFNVQIISSTRSYYLGQFQDVMTTRQPVFAFLVAVLLNLLQVKFQGKAESPFETHPKITSLAIASLLIYGFAYDAKLTISRNPRRHHHPSSPSNMYSARDKFICCSMAIFGPISLASILSILVPERFCPLLFSLAILFTLSQLPRNPIKTMWSWLTGLIRNKFCIQPQGRTTTGVVGFISARLPWIPEHPTIDEIDLVPV